MRASTFLSRYKPDAEKFHHSSLNFLLLVGLIFSTQFIFLRRVLELGLTHDDWIKLLQFKLLGPNPLFKIFAVWREKGPYFTYQIYYIGILESIFGPNVYAFHITNLIFRSLAILLLYPAVSYIFRHRVLAFLTTVLYAVSYSSVENLGWLLMGSDYLAISWMSIFLIIYCYTIRNNLKTLKWLFLLSFFFLATILFSTTRLYPLLVLPPIVELYLWVRKNYSLKYLKSSVRRLLAIFFPFILISLLDIKDVTTPFNINPPMIYQKIIEGNWQLILTPISGLGYTILPGGWSKVFATADFTNFSEYLYFIIGGPVCIFGFLSLVISKLVSEKPWRLFFRIVGVNFFLEIIFFSFFTHVQSIPVEQRMHFAPEGVFPTLIGLYILVFAFFYAIEWIRDRTKQPWLSALWVGPLFAMSFIVLTWLIADYNLSFRPVHRYLTVASAGTSLFVAGFLYSVYEKARRVKGIVLKPFLFATIPLVIFNVCKTSYVEIQRHFKELIESGRSASGQTKMHEGISQALEKYDFDDSQPSFFYFDTSEDEKNSLFYYESFLGSNFLYWIKLRESQVIEGCLAYIWDDKEKLKSLVSTRNGRKGLVYRSFCVDTKKGTANQDRIDVFFDPENFYAFKIKNKQFIDMRAEMLEELGFN